MSKQDFKVEKSKYTVLDGFRFFFFLIVSVILASLAFDIVLTIVASSKGIERAVLDASETVQVLSYVINPVIFILYFIVYNVVNKKQSRDAFSDGQKISLLPISVSIVLAIIAIFLFTPLMDLVEYGFMNLGYNPDNSIPMQDKMSASFSSFMLGLLVYALIPAIAEEIVFRGVIQKSMLSKYNGFTAIFVSTLLFVLMHGALQQTVYQLIMGIMLGYVACVGGSILYSIILHFLNNAFVLLFGCFNLVGYLSEETYYYNIYSMIFPICLFMLGAILVGILFWVLKYLRTKNFFRYTPKKKKKKKAEETVEVKLTLKDMWKDLKNNEKIFAFVSIALIGIIWLINTISQFIVT
jgi:membrane protease YdiL (CAAX protease family)